MAEENETPRSPNQNPGDRETGADPKTGLPKQYPNPGAAPDQATDDGHPAPARDPDPERIVVEPDHQAPAP